MHSLQKNYFPEVHMKQSIHINTIFYTLKHRYRQVPVFLPSKQAAYDLEPEIT